MPSCCRQAIEQVLRVIIARLADIAKNKQIVEELWGLEIRHLGSECCPV